MRRPALLLSCVTLLALASTTCVCTANNTRSATETGFLDDVAEDRDGLQSLLNWAIGAQLPSERECTGPVATIHQQTKSK